MAHRDLMFVRAAETAQIGNDDVGDLAEHRNDPAVVMAVARPSVQQHDGGAPRVPKRSKANRNPSTGALRDHIGPFWPYFQPDWCKVSESPVMTARMLRHASDGQFRMSLCACGPAISRPSS